MIQISGSHSAEAEVSLWWAQTHGMCYDNGDPESGGSAMCIWANGANDQAYY